MKKSLIGFAALAACSLALATYQSPVTVTGTGSNIVNSGSSSGASVSGVGSSHSSASNVQGAASWMKGSGSYSSGPATQKVTLDNCDTVTVNGTKTIGSVVNSGGVQVYGASTAKNTSNGAGATGAAAAGGVSFATVEGVTTLAKPNMNLSAGGFAVGKVETGTGVVGTNGSGASNGSLAANYKAGATGSLFTYKQGSLVGDVKDVNTYTNASVGGIPTWAGNGCGGGKCTTGSSVSNNATVAGDAGADAGGDITYTFNGVNGPAPQ